MATEAELRSVEVVCAAIGPRNGLSIRPWRVEEAGVLLDAWHDPEIARWNPVPPQPTIELATSWIAGTGRQNEASIGIDVVLISPADEVLGEVGLQVNPEQNIAEVGFWLTEQARGRGYACSLLEFAEALAGELDLLGLIGLTDQGNLPAAASMSAAGWVEIPTKSERRGFAYRVPGTI